MVNHPNTLNPASPNPYLTQPELITFLKREYLVHLTDFDGFCQIKKDIRLRKKLLVSYLMVEIINFYFKPPIKITKLL